MSPADLVDKETWEILQVAAIGKGSLSIGKLEIKVRTALAGAGKQQDNFELVSTSGQISHRCLVGSFEDKSK